ncbi:hypothetical protein Tco_0436267 [Tanacetum coccineum]
MVTRWDTLPGNVEHQGTKRVSSEIKTTLGSKETMKTQSSKAMLAIDGVELQLKLSTNRTHPSAQRNMVPRAVLMKTGLKPFNTARTVNNAHPKSTVFNAKPMSHFSKSAQSTGKPQHDDTGFIDSGCSRHMTRNIAYLSYFKEFDGGYVTFGGGAHGATARTTDDGEVEITATIDGQVKTITEASLRRHLKLEDSDGIPSLPNTEIFEQLALMGMDVDAGGAATTDIGLDASQGSDRDEVLENDLQQTKKDKDAEEDSSKQGRKISNINKDPTISLVHPKQDMEYDFDVSIAKGFTTASVLVTTASAFISTASATPEVSTAATNLVYIRKSAEKRKDKGKTIMKEDKSVQKKAKKQLEQERLGHEEAIRLQEQIQEDKTKRMLGCRIAK